MTKLSAEDTESGQHKPRPRSLRLRWKAMTIGNQIMVTATVLIFIANAAYVWVAHDQLAEIRTSSNDTHALALAAEKQAAASGKTADAAKAQSAQAEAQTMKMGESIAKTDDLIKATRQLASAAETQAGTSRLALTASQSPSFTLSSTLGAALALNQKVTLRARFNNDGKGPGIVSGLITLAVGPPDRIDLLPWNRLQDEADSFDEQSVSPNAWIEWSETSNFALLQNDLSRIQDGKVTFYIYGTYSYRDSLNNAYPTKRFCFQYEDSLRTPNGPLMKLCLSPKMPRQ
jgi:hypothetical protein